MEVVLFKNNIPVLRGKQEKIRETIESMLESRIGMYVMLQESTDDGDFQIYLHTDNYDELTERDIQQLAAMKITEEPEIAMEGLKRLLNVDFLVVN